MIKEESREEDEGRGGEGSESKDSEEEEAEAGGDREGEEDLEEESGLQMAGEDDLLLLALKMGSFIVSGSEEEGMKGRGRGEERKKMTSSKKEERFDLQNG